MGLAKVSRNEYWVSCGYLTVTIRRLHTLCDAYVLLNIRYLFSVPCSCMAALMFGHVHSRCSFTAQPLLPSMMGSASPTASLWAILDRVYCRDPSHPCLSAVAMWFSRLCAGLSHPFGHGFHTITIQPNQSLPPIG